MTAIIATIMTRSPSKSVTPDVNNSFSASTSAVSHVLMLELVVNLASQIEHDVLADAVKQHTLKIRKYKSRQLDRDVDQSKQRNSVCFARNDEPIDCILAELWLQDAQQI